MGLAAHGKLVCERLKNAIYLGLSKPIIKVLGPSAKRDLKVKSQLADLEDLFIKVMRDAPRKHHNELFNELEEPSLGGFISD